jgi:hypothetical protein
VATLRGLGMRAHQAHRAGQAYRVHDERSLAHLLELWGGDEATYFDAARRATEEAEKLLREATPSALAEGDGAFDNDALRADASEPPR